MPESKEVPAWTYEHPTDHPDNKPPVTIVAEATEEAVEEYEIKVNDELEKNRPEELTKSVEMAKEPLRVQLVDPEKEKQERDKDNKESVDYESKTVPELKEMAAEKGIQIPWDANKGDIIKALKKGK